MASEHLHLQSGGPGQFVSRWTASRLGRSLLVGVFGCALLAAPEGAQAQGGYEQTVKDLLAAEEGVADSLAKITDVTSARANAMQVKNSLEKLAQVTERMQAMPKPGKAEDSRLESLYGQRAKSAQDRATKEIARVQGLPGVQAALRTTVPGLFSLNLAPGRRAAPAPGAGANMPGGRPGLRGGGDQFAPDRMLKITVTGANGFAVSNAINDKIKAILDAQVKGAPASFQSSTNNSMMQITLGPWDLPPQEFAAKIDFGKVTRVQDRDIQVAATLKAADIDAAQRRPAAGNAPRPGTGGGLGLMPGDKPGAAGAGAENADWTVAVDPSTWKLELAPGKDLSITVPPAFWGDSLVFPTTPSPFVVVGGNGNANEGREVWDLRTRKRAGGLRGELKVSKPLAVSPDGQFFAAKGNIGKQVGVWSLKAGRGIRALDVTSPFTDFLDFAGPDQIVTGVINERLFQVWNYQTGALVHEIRVPVAPEKESPALSPGRKYLALASSQDSRLRVYDLTSGTLAGAVNIPKEGAFPPKCLGLTFSDDGTELAGVFETFPKLHVIVWDVAKGELITGHTFDDKSGVKKDMQPQGRALEWMPGGKAWLLFGSSVVDRKTGKKVWTLPIDEHAGYPEGPRRVVDAERALLLFGRKDNATLRLAPIPKDALSARAQK